MGVRARVEVREHLQQIRHRSLSFARLCGVACATAFPIPGLAAQRRFQRVLAVAWSSCAVPVVAMNGRVEVRRSE
jgi:hypothetical protein